MTKQLPPASFSQWLGAMRNLLIALGVLASLSACGEDNPTTPNRPPAISGVVTFPNVLGPSDSALVTVQATDPDNDVLVYDWVTDARLRIKGAPGIVYLFGSSDSSQIFYFGTIHQPVDTAWIQCTVRDGKGGADARIVFLELHDDTMSVPLVGYLAQKVRRMSGIDRFHVHQLRHTFACRWLE